MKGIKITGMALALTMLMSQPAVMGGLFSKPEPESSFLAKTWAKTKDFVTDNRVVNGVSYGLNYTKDKFVDGYNYSAGKLGDGFVLVKDNPGKSVAVGLGVVALVGASYVLYKKYLAKTEETDEETDEDAS